MEVSEQNLKILHDALAQSFDPDAGKRKEAESFLSGAESQPGIATLDLHLISMEMPEHVRQAGAVYFKNYVKKYWAVPEGDTPEVVISEEERAQIKNVIVDLMLSVPPKVQKQLSAALKIISQSDFPAKWPELLPNMATKFDTGDFTIINGVLATADSIMKRYRSVFKKEEVLRELDYIHDYLADNCLKILHHAVEKASAEPTNGEQCRQLFTAAVKISSIFYSLNSVEMFQHVEDNLLTWFETFLKILKYEPQLKELVAVDEDTPGLLLRTQAAVCQICTIMAEKYEEEFLPYLQQFVETVWGLLVSAGKESFYDRLLATGMGFLTAVSTSVHYSMFEKEEVLRGVCEKVVVPNMMLRGADLELFEMNPVEYIRRDIEGSDSHTRRRGAVELVKGLRKHFEAPVTAICKEYVAMMLGQYASDPKGQWQAKDGAIFLVSALSITRSTRHGGTTSVNPLLDILQFFAEHVLPELQNPSGGEASVLVGDCLKFATSFRALLPPTAVAAVLPCALSLLAHPDYVVHSYAALWIDKIFTVREEGGGLRYTLPVLEPHLEATLTSLFAAMEHEESKENQYLMRCLMRVLHVGQGSVAPYVETTLAKLNAILSRVYKNPTSPNFNHFMFECVGALINNLCSANASLCAAFEELLLPAFQAILAEEIPEFVPYVLQLLALLLELRPEGDMGEVYPALFPSLLAPPMWLHKGNVPALVRLLSAFIMKAPSLVQSAGVEPVLGIFQKLIASSSTDHEGFFLVEALITYMPPAAFQSYLKTLFQLVFMRLEANKSIKLKRSLIVFISLLAGLHGPALVVESINGVQPGLFRNVAEAILLANVLKVSGVLERKICALGLVKLMCECPLMLEPTYFPLWGGALQACISLLEDPVDDSVRPEDVEHYEGESEYSAQYNSLTYARKKDVDPYPGVEPRAQLALGLHALASSHPGRLTPVVGECLGERVKVLMAYFGAAGVPEPYMA